MISSKNQNMEMRSKLGFFQLKSNICTLKEENCNIFLKQRLTEFKKVLFITCKMIITKFTGNCYEKYLEALDNTLETM